MCIRDSHWPRPRRMACGGAARCERGGQRPLHRPHDESRLGGLAGECVGPAARRRPGARARCGLTPVQGVRSFLGGRKPEFEAASPASSVRASPCTTCWNYLATGMSSAEILRGFPELTEVRVCAAIGFAAMTSPGISSVSSPSSSPKADTSLNSDSAVQLVVRSATRPCSSYRRSRASPRPRPGARAPP